MNFLSFVLILFKLIGKVTALKCYQCASNVPSVVDNTVRVKLLRQNVFFPPDSSFGYDRQCHQSLNRTPTPRIEVCYYPMCVTITPQIQDFPMNYTIRGCVDSILKFSFRSMHDTRQELCEFVSVADPNGKPYYPNNPAHFGFVVCYCKHHYCNRLQQPRYMTTSTTTTSTTPISSPFSVSSQWKEENPHRNQSGHHKNKENKLRHHGSGGRTRHQHSPSYNSVVKTVIADKPKRTNNHRQDLGRKDEKSAENGKGPISSFHLQGNEFSYHDEKKERNEPESPENGGSSALIMFTTSKLLLLLKILMLSFYCY